MPEPRPSWLEPLQTKEPRYYSRERWPVITKPGPSKRPKRKYIYQSPGKPQRPGKKYGYWSVPRKRWQGPPSRPPSNPAFKPYPRSGKPFGGFGYDPFVPKRLRNAFTGPLAKLARRGILIVPGGIALDIIGGLIPFGVQPGDPVEGPWIPLASPSSFRTCDFVLDWDGGTFYVDQGDVLGEDLTCLSGQAIFSSNFADSPSNHRNLALMQPYWVLRPQPGAPDGVKRSASRWVKHTPPGEVAPHPIPQPWPFGAPGGSDGFPKAPPNPFDPNQSSPLEMSPDPSPMPYRQAVGSRPRPYDGVSESGGFGVPGLPGVPEAVVPAPSWATKRPTPPYHEQKKPPRRTREIKTKLRPTALMRFLRRFAGMYYAYTETDDILDALLSSIPPKYVMRVLGHWPKNAMEKAEVLYAEYQNIRPNAAIAALAENFIEDWAIGKWGSLGKKGIASAARNGYWKRPVGSSTGGWKLREITNISF